MNYPSILLTIAVTSTLSVLVAACGAPAADPVGEESQAQKVGTGGGNPNPYPTPPTVVCGAYSQLSTSGPFGDALINAGCGMFEGRLQDRWVAGASRFAFATGGAMAESVTYCPPSAALDDALSQFNYPPYSPSTDNGSGGYSTCSDWTQPIPNGFLEVDYDPNCSGQNCGTIRM